MNNKKSIIDKFFSPSVKNPFSRLHFILSILIGILFIKDSFRIIFNTGFSEQGFKIIFALSLGMLSLLNALSIFKANNFKI
ncbi:hypothetical protein [uncultured Clostridium sp.]|uniref:hypothetical protein n=1 Tax=uncultured Clostridium sp. TaxID=59620 RepID=UPI0026081AF5|nr:hypothetical protein [uncultured Clostridium sp.]